MNNNSRIPLHIQNPELVKATGAQVNPSYESFREHTTYVPNYEVQKFPDRPSTHAMSIIRRNPDGTLDYQWAKNMVIDAVHSMHYPHALLPIHQALLTVIYPNRFRAMEPAQAQILTQFSPSEKDKVRELVEAQIKEEENWNTGRGGGSVEGRGTTRSSVG